MKLLSTAHTKLNSRAKQIPTHVPLEEMELYLAYLNNDVTFGQVTFALGRSYGYAKSWLVRCMDYLYAMKLMQITHRGHEVRFSPKEESTMIGREATRVNSKVRV